MTTTIDDLFPAVNHGMTATGTKVLYQRIKLPSKTRSGLILPTEYKELEEGHQTVARVASIGEACFRNKTDGSFEYGLAGPRFKVGDVVRIPRIFSGGTTFFTLDGKPSKPGSDGIGYDHGYDDLVESLVDIDWLIHYLN